VAGIAVAVVITATAIGWRLGLHPVLAFWIIYVLTRPLGASIGDYLSQPTADGGLGLGATLTSLIFFAAIIAVVVYLSVTKAGRRSTERSTPCCASCARPARTRPRRRTRWTPSWRHYGEPFGGGPSDLLPSSHP
jgi:hypothetical protein